MKRTFRLVDRKLVEVTHIRSASVAPFVQPDYPDYQSPVDGQVVHGKRGRRYDLARTQSRPWEGREAEQKEADRHNHYDEVRQDHRLNESLQKAYAQLHPDKRRILNNG